MRATRAEVHLNSLANNLQILRRSLDAAVKICAAVKADAYGHGAVACARALERAGADYFGLATAEEAHQLRLAGISRPLLILGLVTPEEIPALIRDDIHLVVPDLEYLNLVLAAARETGHRASVHLKVDVGMGRVGCLPEEVLPLGRTIKSHPELEFSGFCTHFPSADNGCEEPTRSQIRLFTSLVAQLEAEGLRPPLVHGANSATLLNFPEAHFDMVRPGILLYGYVPDLSITPPEGLLPVMALKTRVSGTKVLPAGAPVSYGGTYLTKERTLVATLPLGYADGYFRAGSNKAPVRVAGHLTTVAGRVCMDQIVVDLGPASQVTRGDEALLFGPEGPTAWDLAAAVGTIPYEITCAVSKRVPRVYLD